MAATDAAAVRAIVVELRETASRNSELLYYGISSHFRTGADVREDVTVTVPIRMDDGSLRIFFAHRVQHHLSRGPVKGGPANGHPALPERPARMIE